MEENDYKNHPRELVCNTFRCNFMNHIDRWLHKALRYGSYITEGMQVAKTPYMKQQGSVCDRKGNS
jgi:uncharacterized glyoxalase superfamily protein PhnB